MDGKTGTNVGGFTLKPPPDTIWFEHPVAGRIHWYPSTQNKLTWTQRYVGENLGSDLGFLVDLP